MPAQKTERTVWDRVQWALQHADPDIRALAEGIIEVAARLRVVEARLAAEEGDGK